MADRHHLLLVVDLDGTLLRGDEPVHDYAAAVTAELAEDDRASLLAAVRDYLREGVAAARHHAADAAALGDALDGWDLVARLAERRGVSRRDLDRAFLATREGMARADYPVEVPAAFAETLRELAGDVRRLLVTNSPPAGLPFVFDRFGVTELFDEIVPGANKPAGLRELLPRELDRIGAPDAPWRACSIGDLWRNDLEPAAVLGAATLYIDRFGRADGVATGSAATVEGLLPALRRWAAAPDTFIEAGARERGLPVPAESRRHQTREGN